MCADSLGAAAGARNMDHWREALQKQGYSLHAAARVDSTNNWALSEAAAGAPEGSVYLAEEQTAGRGSRGRDWASPAGEAVYMSLVLRPAVPLARVPQLTLVMGLAAAEGLQAVSGLPVGIKWPNDVVCGGKKLVGILTELGQGGAAVSGIGINCNNEAFPEALADRATSLFLLSGRRFDRMAVAAAVLAAFRTGYDSFVSRGDLSGVRERYEALLVNKGQRVRVLDARSPFTGTALGIDRMGELLVRREDSGDIARIFAGEVSVRGVYGYV